MPNRSLRAEAIRRAGADRTRRADARMRWKLAKSRTPLHTTNVLQAAPSSTFKHWNIRTSLAELHFAKVDVEGSNPFSRSIVRFFVLRFGSRDAREPNRRTKNLTIE